MLYIYTVLKGSVVVPDGRRKCWNYVVCASADKMASASRRSSSCYSARPREGPSYDRVELARIDQGRYVKAMVMQYVTRLICDKGTEPAPRRAGTINKFDSVSFETDARVTTIFALQTLRPDECLTGV
jgi:hypothetical protein